MSDFSVKLAQNCFCSFLQFRSFTFCQYCSIFWSLVDSLGENGHTGPFVFRKVYLSHFVNGNGHRNPFIFANGQISQKCHKNDHMGSHDYHVTFFTGAKSSL